MNRDRNVVTRAEQLRAVLGPAVLPDTWFTVSEAAAYMKCTRGYIEKACREDRIRFARMGRRFILKRQDCDAHIEGVKTQAVA